MIVRLLHLKDMPSYENVMDLINKNTSSQPDVSILDENYDEKNLNEKNEIKNISKDQIKNTTQTKLQLESSDRENEIKNHKLENISSFEDLIKLSSNKKEVELKYDLENNVNLVKFSEGKIDISFNENLRKNFVRNLSEKLLEWTEKRWVITLTREEGQKTISETQSINKRQLMEGEKKEPIYKKFKNVFVDAELVEVSKKD